MPQGLQCFDANGVLTFNSGDYLSRFIGLFSIGQATGSINIPAWQSGGTPLAIYLPDNTGNEYTLARLTISGATLSWDWPNDNGASGSRRGGTVVYGFLS